MISKDIALGLLFLFQTGFGALGNSFLLGLYTITFFIGLRLRSIDLLLSHLTFVNDLVLLSKGITQTIAALGFNNFLDDVGCKLVFYLHRVARGLSLCTTCFLSGFQAITLSPRNSRWAELRARAPRYIILFCFLCWTFHLLTNCYILLYFRGLMGSKNNTDRNDLIYCSSTIDASFNVAVYVLIVFLPDILCVGIMVGTSGYMVFILYRHHQRVQYIHGNNLMLSSSPETRATQTILLLVSMFASFYCLNSILLFYMESQKSTSWLVHMSAFLAACFPACSPFVLIVHDAQVLNTLWLCGIE
ncbi:LOW QUALITY PROTEIN: vomeronasal type-1 receptor 1-like [Petaurus breviceps papuanus]|uniref:LOW QUALITY PROTEIN: vomeronasal type-1 receptor 1-like n=1 Tax=Petaurus breviceps papuanus TaxID=3040969 RepID=UPI0036DBD08D